MDLESIYQPSPWQWRYHLTERPDTRERREKKLPAGSPIEILGAGSAGPGKTTALVWDPIITQAAEEHLRCANPRHPFPLRWGESKGKALHLRRAIPHLEQTIAETHKLFPKLDPGAKWDQQNKTWLFQSGYTYKMGHCVEKNDWQQYFSQQFTHIGFDESVQFETEQYDQIRGRCRTTDPVLKYKLRVCSMSNPVMRSDASVSINVSNPHWVRDRFVEPHPEGNVMLIEPFKMQDGTPDYHCRIYLPARLTDNPDLEFRRQYEATLQGLPEHIRQAQLFGNWYLVVGAFFSAAWNPQMHVSSPVRIPDDWPKFRTMDWGYKQPGCIHWWAMDEEDNLVCFYEYTFKEKDVGEVAKDVHEIEVSLGLTKSETKSPITGPADTQLWEQRGDAVASKAEVFASKGVSWVQADKRSRQRNAEELTRRLRGDSLGAKIVFFTGCVNAIRTIPTIGTDDKKPEVPKDGGPDHWLDSVLYACAYASRGRIGHKTSPHGDADDDDDEEPAAKRGALGYGLMV